MLIRDNCLIIIRHEINKKSALLLADFALQRPWLQVAGEEDIKRAVIDTCIVFARVLSILNDGAVGGQLLDALGENFRPIHDLLVQLEG